MSPLLAWGSLDPVVETREGERATGMIFNSTYSTHMDAYVDYSAPLKFFSDRFLTDYMGILLYLLQYFSGYLRIDLQGNFGCNLICYLFTHSRSEGSIFSGAGAGYNLRYNYPLNTASDCEDNPTNVSPHYNLLASPLYQGS